MAGMADAPGRTGPRALQSARRNNCVVIRRYPDIQGFIRVRGRKAVGPDQWSCYGLIRSESRRLSPIKAEALSGCSLHFLSDLNHGLTSKRLVVLLGRDDLLGERAEHLNVIAGINLTECGFEVEPLLD